MKPIKRFLKTLEGLIFPNSCLLCNKIIKDGNFCSEDWNKLKFLQPPACSICFEPFEFESDKNLLCAKCLQQKPAYHQLISVFRYNGEIAKLISNFKYHDQTKLAKFFSKMMFNSAKEILPDIDFIAPIPLHKMRLIKRKYNQSAILGQEIAKLSNREIILDLLIRSKNTSAQAGLNKKSRQKNLKSAFKINPKYYKKIKDKNILLIDDVTTTGTTINECSKILEKAKTKKIYILTIAKTILN